MTDEMGADRLGEVLPLRSLRSRSRVDRDIGQRIAERRHVLGLGLAELADAAKTTAAAIERFEAGAERVPVDKLLMLAEKLDVPLAYLFNRV